MSIIEDSDDFEFEHFFLCLDRSFESDEELETYFKKVSAIENPEFLGNHSVEVDLDSPQESKLRFSAEDLDEYEGPLAETNYLLINVTDFSDEEVKFHIHCNISNYDLVEDFSAYLDKIVSELDNLDLNSNGTTLTSNKSFTAYDLPIDFDHECDVFSVRISSGQYRYLFQDDSEYGDEDTTTFQSITNREFIIDGTNAVEFITEEIEGAVDFIKDREQ